MDSFAARFSESKYIKVDIDFDSGDNAVTIIAEIEGTPVTINGSINWEEIDSDDGEGLG